MAYDPHTLPLYVQMAEALDAYRRTNSPTANAAQREWSAEWRRWLTAMAQALPQGSGFDDYPTIDDDASTDKAVVIHGGFHNMNEHGYCGWTRYRVTVRPDWRGPDIRVSILSGSRANGLADYIGEVFHSALAADYDRAAFTDDMPMPDNAADRQALYISNATTALYGVRIRYVPADAAPYNVTHAGLLLCRGMTAAEAADKAADIVKAARLGLSALAGMIGSHGESEVNAARSKLMQADKPAG